MDGLASVIFVPDDTAKTGYPKPMLLQNLMGAPLLAWLADSLAAGGVERFFLICGKPHLELARSCFPEQTAVYCAEEEEQISERLQAFLSESVPRDQDVIVVTGPCVLLPFAAVESSFDGPPAAANMICIGRTALLGALRQNLNFLPFLLEYGNPYTDRDGVYNVSSMTELADWQPVLHYVSLYRRIQAGVEIWDYNTVFVDPRAQLEPGVVLLPGTVIRGKTKIGSGTTVGPNALVEDAVIGRNCRIAPNAVLYPGAALPDGTNFDPLLQQSQTVAELRMELEALKETARSKKWKI